MIARAQLIPARADVGVVGGGVIGLAIAEELSARGRQVVVLERGRGRDNSTWAAAGMLAPSAEADVELPGLVEFRKLSHALYPEFVSRLEARSGASCGFRTDGTLLVSLDRDDEAEVERLHAIMADQGFGVRRLTTDEVLKMEPRVSSRVTGGMLLEHDYQVDPRRLSEVLRAALEARGGRVFLDAAVEAAGADGQVAGRCVTDHVTRPFEIRCDVVVIAAGSWCNVGLRSPCSDLPLRPVKGQILRLRGETLVRHVVRTPRVYVVPRTGGELVIGATVEEQGFDAHPTAGGVLDLLRHAWRALPGIYELNLEEVVVGFRPTLRDHLPALGRLGNSRVYVATGHYRNGILAAPGTAKLMADLICDGQEHALLRTFSPERFAVTRPVPGRVTAGTASDAGPQGEP